MRIVVTDPPKKTIRLIFPNILLFNFFTAWIVSLIVKSKTKQKNKQSPAPKRIMGFRDLCRLFAVIRRSAKQCRKSGLDLVTVESRDGNFVNITL